MKYGPDVRDIVHGHGGANTGSAGLPGPRTGDAGRGGGTLSTRETLPYPRRSATGGTL